MKSIYTLILIPLMLFSCKPSADLPTVQKVDLDKYSGLWHEIARLPASFQKNCDCTTAQYEIESSHVKVINRCYDGKKGKWKEAQGKAWAVEGSDNSKLKVQFFWPFKGDYFIIELDEQYQYAMVGSPSRDYLWILSRSKKLDKSILDKLLDKASSLGFDTSKLIYGEQDCE